MLQELGAACLDADKIGHEALDDKKIRKQVIDRFGEDILDSRGRVDRKRLSERVFGQAQALKDLAGITHPWIGAKLRERLEALRSSGTYPAICLDVSLLLESGKYEDCVDTLVFIEADKALRDQRAVTLRGWQPDEAGRREAHQMALDVKKTRADVVLTNNGDMNELKKQVQNFWNERIKG